MTIEDAKVIVGGCVALLCLFLLIQAVYFFRAQIAGFVSGQWRASLEKARQQKAAREAAYGYTVNTSQNVMSPQDGRRQQTRQTDEADRPVSVDNSLIERLKVDRTKIAVIELLVYSGWDTSQVRAVLKGDNGVLGTEVEAAQKRLGIAPAVPHITPIAGRLTPAQFDADYPYKPLEV